MSSYLLSDGAKAQQQRPPFVPLWIPSKGKATETGQTPSCGTFFPFGSLPQSFTSQQFNFFSSIAALTSSFFNWSVKIAFATFSDFLHRAFPHNFYASKLSPQPTGPATVFSAINTVRIYSYGYGTNPILWNIPSPRLSSAFFKFPTIQFFVPHQRNVHFFKLIWMVTWTK